jgi:hypothetical protein
VSPAADKKQGPKPIIDALHAECTKAVATSFEARFDQINGQSYGLASDLDVWVRVLSGRIEGELYATAAAEYVSSLLNVSQGQYRNSFKGLRLVLELILQGIYLSANLVLLEEWLGGEADTVWQAILHQENGIFARRFCRAFLADVIDEIDAFKSLAETLYREMSECTHGNVPKRIPLPTKVAFDEPTFQLWHQKAGTLRLLVNFALAMRYLEVLNDEEIGLIGPILMDQLGHLGAIRRRLGGPA